MVEYKSGSVYAEWHRDVRYPYVKTFIEMVKQLGNIPRFSDMIIDSDIEKLIELCETFGINYDGMDLKNRITFMMLKGKIKRKMKEILEKELKPEDPLFRFLAEQQQLEDDEIRAFMKQQENE